MRRAVIFLILIAICFGVAFTTYTIYENISLVLPRTEMVYEEITLSNGDLTGLIKCEHVGRALCGYDYTVNGDTLFFTFYVTAGDNRALETEDGYYSFCFEDVGEIKKVCYRDNNKEHSLSFNKE